MIYLLSIGISAGLIAGIFAQYAAAIKVVSWVSFIGIASFYGAGGKEEGVVKSTLANLSGVVWGVIIFQLLALWSFQYAMGILVFLAVIGMCAQARFKLLSFIPGTFLGISCLFGTGGNWQSTVIALLLGAIMGWVSEKGGIMLSKVFSNNTKEGQISS